MEIPENAVQAVVEIKSNGIKAMADESYNVTFNFPEYSVEAVKKLMDAKARRPIGRLIFISDESSGL